MDENVDNQIDTKPAKIPLIKHIKQRNNRSEPYLHPDTKLKEAYRFCAVAAESLLMMLGNTALF